MFLAEHSGCLTALVGMVRNKAHRISQCCTWFLRQQGVKSTREPKVAL